jgi:CMP/dCMP kinase
MIITISGTPGSGKSTAGKALASKLGFRHFSAGDFMREIAAKKGVTLNELGKIAEKDHSIDEELDKRTAMLGKDQDDFVMDSRLAYHFIPNSFKVFLEVSDKEAAKRIFGDIQEKKQARVVEKENTTFESTLKSIRQRKESEQLRYRNYYNLDPYDRNQYDLVIDTTKTTPDQVIDRIIAALKERTSCC